MERTGSRFALAESWRASGRVRGGGGADGAARAIPRSLSRGARGSGYGCLPNHPQRIRGGIPEGGIPAGKEREVDLRPLRPKQRQREKRFDGDLFGVASSMGVVQSELENLLAGYASLGIAKKLGVTRMDLQRFIAGEVSMSMAFALGMLQPQAQALRDRVEREGAIGILMGICVKAP